MTRPLKNPILFLFLDYDGTLVPIKKRPELARLHPARKRLLEALSQKYFLTVVTGRDLKNIKAMVGIRNAAYIGNHGLEISFQGKHWVHPEVRKISFALKNSLKKIKAKIRTLPGAWIEDKALTASIHYRSMSVNKKFILKNIILDEMAGSNGLLKWTEGKKVFEIRPNLDWDKGRGIQKLLQWIEESANKVKVYIGDDTTDEDAFQIFGKGDITIKVGPKKKTCALYCFPGVSSVWKFLTELNRLQ